MSVSLSVRNGAWSLLGLVCLTGCQFVPRSDYAASESRVRALTEQSHAQLSEIDNLQRHARELEDRVLELEQATAQQKSPTPLRDEKFY